MVSQKVPKFVTPAKAGVQNLLERLDSGFRRNDAKREFLTFYEGVKIYPPLKRGVRGDFEIKDISY